MGTEAPEALAMSLLVSLAPWMLSSAASRTASVIAFLKDQGADADTIRLVEVQCSGKTPETVDACSEASADKEAKEKQSASECADAFQSIQESVNENPVLISGSQQGRALNHHQKDPAMMSIDITTNLLYSDIRKLKRG